MATTILPNGTASQRASADMHIARRVLWVAGTRKRDGQPFWIMPSSNRQAAYYVAKDGTACTCEGARRYPTCSHQLAARLVLAAPKPREGYADLLPTCQTDGCSDVSEGYDSLCDKHASDREYELRLASMRTRLANL